MLNSVASSVALSAIDGAKPASDCITSMLLSAGAARRISVPAGARVVKISAPQDIYVRWNTSQDAIVPVADDLVGNAAQLNPNETIILRGLPSFSVISPNAQAITLAWWS